MVKKNIKLEETVTRDNLSNPASGLIDPNLDRFDLRMQEAISTFGSIAEVARRCGLSEAVIRSYRDGNSDPSRQRIVAMWKGLGFSIDWLVAGVGPMWAKDSPKWPQPLPQSDSQPLRHDALIIAVQLAEEVLEGKTLEPAKRAELVALVYEGLVEGLPEATVLRWARTASK